MSESDPKNHWSALASEIGADVPPEPEPQRPETETDENGAEAEPAATMPPARPERSARRPKPSQPKNHWNAVAGDLGMEVPDTEPESEAELEAEPAAETPFGSFSVEPAIVDAKPQQSPPEGDPSAAFESLFQPSEETVGDDSGDAGEPEEIHTALFEEEEATEASEGVSDSTEEAEDEERPRRRRRRRGRRRRRDEKSDEEQTPEEVAETVAIGDDSVEVEVAEVIADEATEKQSEPAAADDGEEEEGKRRRRRRRRKPRRDREQAAEDESEADSAADDAPSEEPDGRKAKSARVSEDTQAKHRKIPSWDEAIGVVVEANIQAHAKSGGGRRGRRGKRGGS